VERGKGYGFSTIPCSVCQQQDYSDGRQYGKLGSEDQTAFVREEERKKRIAVILQKLR